MTDTALCYTTFVKIIKRLVSNFIARGKPLIQNRFYAGPLKRMRAV
jgi:hypothetical protein